MVLGVNPEKIVMFVRKDNKNDTSFDVGSMKQHCMIIIAETSTRGRKKNDENITPKMSKSLQVTVSLSLRVSHYLSITLFIFKVNHALHLKP